MHTIGVCLHGGIAVFRSRSGAEYQQSPLFVSMIASLCISCVKWKQKWKNENNHSNVHQLPLFLHVTVHPTPLANSAGGAFSAIPLQRAPKLSVIEGLESVLQRLSAAFATRPLKAVHLPNGSRDSFSRSRKMATNTPSKPGHLEPSPLGTKE